MIRVESLCYKCKNFDIGDNECKAGQYIKTVGLYVPEVVAECEDFEENKE